MAVPGLVVWSLLAWGAARALILSAELERADAVVVLGGSGSYIERAQSAAQLFREGRAPRIILTNDGQRSGWSSSEQRNPFFFERAREELERAGVPAERIQVLPPVVSSTYEEALVLREYTTMHGLRSILVVTSPYHSRRALWMLQRVFAKSGVEVGLKPSAAGEQTPRPVSWWLYPSGWSIITSEYAKLFYYWLRY
jgi:uncharacterized SAM-binding protein YcdF (DUF218 family)